MAGAGGRWGVPTFVPSFSPSTFYLGKGLQRGDTLLLELGGQNLRILPGKMRRGQRRWDCCTVAPENWGASRLGEGGKIGVSPWGVGWRGHRGVRSC